MTRRCVVFQGRSSSALVKPSKESFPLLADLALDLALTAAARLHLNRHFHKLNFDLALLLVKQDLRVGRETLSAVMTAVLKRPASLRA